MRQVNSSPLLLRWFQRLKPPVFKCDNFLKWFKGKLSHNTYDAGGPDELHTCDFNSL